MFFSFSRSVGFAVWIMASLFYAYQYILRVMPNVMLDEIMTIFGIDTATFGQFSGVYYIGYALIHLPVGIMLDRYGPRKIMSSCIIMTVLGLVPLLIPGHWIYPIIGRFFIGIGSSGAILGLFKVIRMIFLEKDFPRMLSFSVMIGLLGAIYGGGPLSYMRDQFGYHAVIWILIILGLVLAVSTYLIIPEKDMSSIGTVRSQLREVFTNKKVLGIAFFSGLMVGPLEGFADVWGSTFFKQIYKFDGTLASSMPSLIFIGMCFGAPLLQMIAAKLKSFFLAIIGAGVLMALLFIVLIAYPVSTIILGAFLIIIGICCAYQILAIYIASISVREEISGLTTAVTNMVIMLFGYAFHSVIGYTVGYMGGPLNSSALIYGVLVIPAALIVGVLGYSIIFFHDKKSTVGK